MRFFEIVPDEFRHYSDEPTIPARATAYSAAYDLYSSINITIPPKKSATVWTDIRACFPKDEVLLINVRSSMGKYPVMLANTQGWIDSDYYANESNGGNICLMLYNLGDRPYIIRRGDRIAQAMFVNCLSAINGASNVERKGGLGSTNLMEGDE